MSIETYLSAFAKCNKRLGKPNVITIDKETNIATYYIDEDESCRLTRISKKIEDKIIKLIKRSSV